MRDSEITLEKPENTVRIAILGDSFVFGMITDQNKIFPYLLEEKLNKEFGKKKKYEVLNFGVIGYTTDQEYLQLHDKIMTFSPDIVVVMFFAGNDAAEMRAHEWTLDKNGNPEKIHDIYHIIAEDHQLRRKQTGKPLTTPFFTLVYEKGKVLLAKLGFQVQQPRLLWSNFISEKDEWGDPDIYEYFEKVKQMLSAIKKLDDEKGVKTLVTIIPADVQVNLKYVSKYPGAPFSQKEFDDPNLGKRPQTILTEFSAKQNIELLDLLPIFRAVTDDLYFPTDDPHFTLTGHQKTSDELLKKLAELNWL